MRIFACVRGMSNLAVVFVLRTERCCYSVKDSTSTFSNGEVWSAIFGARLASGPNSELERLSSSPLT
ncbi:hypothetical protein SDJN03_12084, partial [Cucurbita argyrosperma subsp. sororia]